jgi:hypothetical protein
MGQSYRFNGQDGLIGGNMSVRVPLRALAVHQPFAELIVIGAKTAEFRSRPTHLRERVYVYACDKLDADDIEWCNENYPHLHVQTLPRGLLVGTVAIVGCEGDELSGYAWQLKNEKKFSGPLTPKKKPCGGAIFCPF